MSYYPFIIKLFIIICILLFLAFVMFSASVLYQRRKKNKIRMLTLSITKKYEDKINTFVFDDNFREKISDPNVRNALKKELLEVKQYENVHKNILINVIISLHN